MPLYLVNDNPDTRAHDLAPDGKTALCGQKLEWPRNGAGGWYIATLAVRPANHCGQCWFIEMWKAARKHKAEMKEKNKAAIKKAKAKPVILTIDEKLARWNEAVCQPKK